MLGSGSGYESGFGSSTGSGLASKNLSIFKPKNCSARFLDPDSGFFPSRIRIPDPGVRKPLDPGSGSATMLYECTFTSTFKDKSQKEIKLVEIQVFLHFFCLLMEGSESRCRSRSGSEQIMTDPDPGG
jgi:hypothetical protein